MTDFSVRGEPVPVEVRRDGAASKSDARRVSKGGPRPDEGRRFFFQNDNPYYVWLRGSSDTTGGFLPAERGKRWHLPPHSTSRPIRTQNPDYMSALPDFDHEGPGNAGEWRVDGRLTVANPILVQYGD
jgi:hypothetical protein